MKSDDQTSKINEIEHRFLSVHREISRLANLINQINDKLVFHMAKKPLSDSAIQNEFINMQNLLREDFKKDLTYIKSTEGKSTKEFSEQIEKHINNVFSEKLIDAKKELTKRYENFVGDIISRIDRVESYLKNDKFHDILMELTKLEDEFHQRAIALVSGVSKPTKSTKRGKK